MEEVPMPRVIHFEIPADNPSRAVEFVSKVKYYGGTQVTDKTEIPGVGTFCYCKDTEGNLFGILQPNMNPMS
jgi:predicted enzyme related to lactoylglutathione lyase